MTVADTAAKRLHKFLITACRMEMQEPGMVPIPDMRGQLAGYVSHNDSRFLLDVIDVLRKTEALLAVAQPNQQSRPLFASMQKLHDDMQQDGKESAIVTNPDELALEAVDVK